MTESLLLPIKPGSLSEKDKAALRKAGVIVIEHEAPETLRLLRPCAEMDSSQMLTCAMKALMLDDSTPAGHQREVFAKAIAAAILAKQPKPEA